MNLRHEYILIRANIKRDIRKAYKNYVDNIEGTLGNNINMFWNFVRHSKNTHQLPKQMTYKGNNLDNEQDIADAFADYFESVYHRDIPTYNLDNNTGGNQEVAWGSVLQLTSLSNNEVAEAIHDLAPKRSVGPDGIPPYIYKACGDFFIQPLVIIFNLVLRTETFPSTWKVAKVCPIYKSGSRNSCENYRSVALLNTPSKLFECILYKRIITFAKPHMTGVQHGFMPGRSTLTNLMIFTHCAAKAMEEEGQLDVI